MPREDVGRLGRHLISPVECFERLVWVRAERLIERVAPLAILGEQSSGVVISFEDGLGMGESHG